VLWTPNGLITENHISGALTIKILHNFDRAIPEVWASEVKATTVIKGKVKHYNQVDNVWTFVLKNAKLTTKENDGKKSEVQELTATNITVLTCPSKESSC
jgi:Transcription initiation factor IIA, gamma subunit